MKSISKWLVPGILQSLDQYLRERYPVVWYCGAHWVLFYGLVGGVLMFGAGLLYPVHWVKRELVDKKYMNLDHWVVDPIKPIEFAHDELYIYSLVLVLAVACIWMFRQFQIKPFFYQVQHSLFCLIIYAGCWWVLCGITAAAFRMGTIVKTAWIWMPERDLQDFKQSGIYPYGFVLLAEDSTDFIPVDTLSFFRKREKIFKRIWKNEETWLKPRYRVDTSYWNKRLKVIDRTHLSALSDRSALSDLSYQSYRSYRPDQSYLSYLSYRSYRPDQSYLSDQPHLLYLSYRLYRPDQSYLLDRSYLSYRSIWSYQPDKSVKYNRLDRSELLIQSTYYDMTRNRIKHPKASAYQLINYNDTLIINPLIIVSSLPNQIEDAVRSVEHSRQFLYEGIFWRYFGHLLYYLLLMVALLLLLPWVSAKRVLPLSVVALLIWFGLQIFEVEDSAGYEAIWKSVHLTAYLLLPLAGLLLLLWMLCQQKQGQLFTTAVNMVFLGVLIVLLGALNVNRGDTLAQFGSPIDGAFYGAQMIGLLAACIVPYVQAMPKTQ